MTALSAVLLTCLTPSQPAPAQPTPAREFKSVAVERAALDDFSLTTCGVVFNNFQVVEQRAQPAADPPPVPMHELAVRGTYRNRTAGVFDYTLVVVGLDADGEVLWACTVAGRARPNSVGVVEAAVPVPEDTLQQTATVRFRARYAGPVLFRPGVGLFGGS